MEVDYKHIKVIGFDADDTLWVNETFFREAELEFARLLGAYETANKIDQELFKKEMDNLGLYGYGVKAFVLSMVESAFEISNGSVSNKTLSSILLKVSLDIEPLEISIADSTIDSTNAFTP